MANSVVPSRWLKALQRLGQLSGKRRNNERSVISLDRGARIVSREFERRQFAAQLSTPVVQLLLQGFVLQPFLLPGREVDILNRQIRQRRGLFSPKKSVVERRQLFLEHSERPPIAGNVMEVQQQRMIFRTQLQHLGAEKRSNPKIKGLFGKGRRQAGHFLLARRFRQIAQTIPQIDHGNAE